MKFALNILKIWTGPVCATILSIALLCSARNYPCLRGAGLALADFEAFLLLAFASLPCLIWAIFKVARLGANAQKPCGQSIWIRRIAFIVGLSNTLFFSIAIPVILSMEHHPFRFICD